MSTGSAAAAAKSPMGQEIKMFDNHVEVQLPTGASKAVSIQDFKAALDKSLNAEGTIDHVLLPANCYIFGKSLSAMTIGCYYLGEKKEVGFIDRETGKEKKYTIPFPNIIVTHKFVNEAYKWKSVGTWYFATDRKPGQLPADPIITHNRMEHIWALPFPNSYGDGRLCYGRNSMPMVFDNNLRGIDWYFRVLFSSPFNSDLTVPSLASAKNPESWIKFLEKKEKFPYDALSGFSDESNVDEELTD